LPARDPKRNVQAEIARSEERWLELHTELEALEAG
jgi:hypothetical protein